MSNFFNRQSQFELFPGAARESGQKSQPLFFNRSFHLSLENIIILCVFIIMIGIVAFSLGVEKGRNIRKKIFSKTPENFAQTPLVASVTVPAAFEVKSESHDSQQVTKEEAQTGMPALSEPEKSVDKKDTLAKIHTIQVASFKEKGRAQREADDLIKAGYEAFIAGKGSYYIVCVGRFADSNQAKSVYRGLKKKYSDCYIRSL
ncbi:MAG: SPOR domain-containing protein [Candidatus Omnitrophota bacterium]